MNYPDVIYVSGLPIAWRGCNGMYVRNGEANGRPVYSMPSHYYLGIGIRPMKIYYDKYWRLYTDDSFGGCVVRGPSSELPYGDWGQCLVTPQESMTTVWRSNDVYIIGLLVLVALSYYMMK